MPKREKHCFDCGYKFEDYDPNECRLCGSTRKSYSSTSDLKGHPRESPFYSTSEPSGSGKKKYVIIPVVIVGIIFAISMAPEMSLPQLPDIIVDDGIYQISISEIPSFADKRTVEIGISKAMMMWENRNPELEFELVEEHGDIRIEWRKFISHDVLGTEAAGYQEGRKLVIELGSYDCRGNWQHYSSNMIADTIAHETGHYLGLGHHTNDSHLMYGHDEFTQIEFDDLGYNIPSPNSKYMSWIEWEKLEQQLERYDSSNNVNAYNRIVEEMNCIADV